MKYKIIIFLILISSIFFLFSMKEDERKTQISFYTLQLGTFSEYMNRVISQFESENPDLKIKWIDVPYSEGEKRALASIMSNNTPDIINLTPDFSLMLAQKNALFFIDEKYLSQFSAPLLESVKFRNKYYAFPFYATSAVTVYNKDLMKNYPIPTNYQEVFDLSSKYNNINSYPTMICFNENDTLLKILNKYDIHLPSDLLSTESIALFKKLRKLYKEGKLPKESITQSHRESLEKYMAGQLAFVNVGVNFINIIKENAPAIFDKTGVAPQVASFKGEYDYSLMNFVIPKKAKHKDEAIKFILFLTNKNNQLEFSKLTSVLSTNKEALENEYFKEINNSLISEARYISANQLHAPIEPINIQKNRKELLSLSSDFIQKVLLTDENIEELLNKFIQDWKKLSL